MEEATAFTPSATRHAIFVGEDIGLTSCYVLHFEDNASLVQF